jgi:MinD superfamily P-loop ATPase
MIIAVASGKGGTGKTTIATNLAKSIGNGVQLIDCDVEEPNSHLFLNPHIEKSEEVYVPRPNVDLDAAKSVPRRQSRKCQSPSGFWNRGSLILWASSMGVLR